MVYYRRINPDAVLHEGAVYVGRQGEAEAQAGLILIDDIPWRAEGFIPWEPRVGDYVTRISHPSITHVIRGITFDGLVSLEGETCFVSPYSLCPIFNLPPKTKEVAVDAHDAHNTDMETEWHKKYEIVSREKLNLEADLSRVAAERNRAKNELKKLCDALQQLLKESL